MSYVTPAQAAQFFNVTQKTLRQWEDQNKIKAQKTKGGHRRYFIQNKTKIKDTTESKKEGKEVESEDELDLDKLSKRRKI